MKQSRQSSMVTVALVVAVLSAALAGCGSSGSTPAERATTIVSETGQQLDVAAVKATTEKADAVESHVNTTISQGDSTGTTEPIATVSTSDKRFRMETGGYAMIGGVDDDVFVKGSHGWTKVTLDPSITEAVEEIGHVTSILDLVDQLDVEFHPDGTVDSDGVTLTRYRANVDGNKLLSLLEGVGPMQEWAKQLPEVSDAKGSVEVGVDASEFARSVEIHMTFTSKGEPGSISMMTTLKPLPDGTTVDPPPADQITSTKHATTTDELGEVISAAAS